MPTEVDWERFEADMADVAESGHYGKWAHCRVRCDVCGHREVSVYPCDDAGRPTWGSDAHQCSRCGHMTAYPEEET